MVKTTSLQTSLAAGMLGAELAEREDVEIYYSGLRDLHNLEPRPGGGAALRPGLAFYGYLRNVLTGVELTGATITAGAQLVGPPGASPPPPPPPPDDPAPYEPVPPWVGGIVKPEPPAVNI